MSTRKTIGSEERMTLLEAVDRGVDIVEALGLEVKEGKHILKKREELKTGFFFFDDEVKVDEVKVDEDELVIPDFLSPRAVANRRIADKLSKVIIEKTFGKQEGKISMNLQLLANKNTNINIKGERNMNKKAVILGAKHESGVAKANAIIGDVIEAMCGEVLAIEEAMERAIQDKKERIARRSIKIAKAVRVPVNKREAGIVTPKMQKKASVNEVVVEKFLNSCNGVAKFFEIGRLSSKKSIAKMNLQLLASGSASTSKDNNNGGNTMFTVGDLTNVPNSAQVITEKSSVILKKRKGKMASFIVSTDKKGEMRVTTALVACPENKYTRELDGIDCTIKVGNSTHNFTKEGDRFIDKFLTVSIDSSSTQAIGQEPIYVNFARNIVAVASESKDGETVYRNTNTGRVVKDLSKLNKYTLALATASGMRAKKQLFNAVYVKLEDGEKVSDVLNKNCHKVIEYANKKMNKAQAAKFMTRPGLAWTGSKALGAVNCLAHYDGVFDADFDRNTFDGVGFVTDAYIAKVLKITKEEARKLSLQSRPGGVIKVQLKVLPEDLFKAVCKRYRKENKLTKHGVGEVEVLYDNNSIKANIDVTNIELEVLAFGKTSKIGFAKQMLEKAILEATKMDKENPDGKTLQGLIDYITDLGKGEIVKLFEELLSPVGCLSPDVDRVYDIINKIGVRNIPAAKRSAVQNTLKRIAKLINKLGFNDGNIYYSVIYTDTAQLFGVEAIKEGEIFYPKFRDEDGKKCIGIKFPSMGAKEYYSAKTISYKTICERIDASNLEGYIKKALKEDYKYMSDSLVVVPASRAVFDSCAGMDIDMDPMALVFTDVFVDILHDKEEFVQLISEDKKGNKVKNEKRNNEKFSLRNSLQRKADNGDARANALLKTNSYNPEDNGFYQKMFSIPATTNSKSIGEITFDNNKSIAIAIECLKGNFEPFNRLIEENIENHNPSKSIYVGLPTVNGNIKVLSEDNIDAMLLDITQTSLSEDNMIEMMLDISRCFRLYQETTIDAAKTGLLVKIAVLCKSIMTKSLIEVKYVEEDINGTRVPKIVREPMKDMDVKLKNGKVVKPLLIEDDMSKIQDELIEFTMNILDEAIEDFGMYIFRGVDSDGVDTLKDKDGNEILDGNNEVIYDMSDKLKRSLMFMESVKKGSVASLLEIRGIYNSLAAEFNNEIGRLELEDSSEEQREALRNQFELKLSSLSNSVEKILSFATGTTDKGTMSLRGSILIGIGALNSKGLVSNTSTNRFAFNVASHYALAYALNNNKYTTDCTVLHCADTVKEGEIKLVHGFSDDNSLIVKENFNTRENGEVVVNVERLENDTVRVTETKSIEVPDVDKDKNVLVLEATVKEILDEKGNAILDASGNTKKEVTCDSGKVLDAMRYGLKVTVVDVDSIKFSFELNKKEHSMTISTSRLKFTDVKIGTTYKADYGYFVDRGFASRVVLELSK